MKLKTFLLRIILCAIPFVYFRRNRSEIKHVKLYVLEFDDS